MLIIIYIVFIIFLFFLMKKLLFLNPKEFFSENSFNIYIITTEKNKNHSISFINSIKTPNDNVYIIDAILDNNKAIGCLKSHKKVLELITNNNNNNKLNLIFEDDVLIVPNSRTVIDNFINKLKNTPYNILFLGYCFEQFPEKTNQTITYQNNQYPIIKLHSPRCTHSYIIDKENAQILLNFINDPLSIKDSKLNDPIDELYGRAIFNGLLTSYGIDFYKQPWQ